MILATLALAALLQETPVAVLESGARVAVTEGKVEIGARTIRTSAGDFDAALDPVVEIIDGSTDLHNLEPLKLHDYRAWVSRVSERGFLDTLLKEKPKDPTDVAHLRETLYGWGKSIDPLSAKLDRDDRVDALWTKLRKADDGEVALLAGRLATEVGESQQNVKRRVSIADLRRGLRDSDPDMRWAATRVALHQREMSVQHKLFEASLEDKDPLIRAAAAESFYGLESEDALGMWAVKMFRGKYNKQRVAAAEHLGSHGSEEPAVIKALVMALGAEGYRAAGSYIFVGTQVSIVQDFDVEVALAAAIAKPRIGVITSGVMLEVRVISMSLSRAVKGSLKKLTGQNPGPSAKDWRDWYEAR